MHLRRLVDPAHRGFARKLEVYPVANVALSVDLSLSAFSPVSSIGDGDGDGHRYILCYQDTPIDQFFHDLPAK